MHTAQQDPDAHSHEHEQKQKQRSIPPRKTSLTGSFTPGEAKQARRLTMVLVLVGVFFVLEFAGARMAGSVVLEADALHLLMDMLALAMSITAMRLAVRRATPRFTFGLRRAEPVAAIFNAMLVLAATAEILREAITQLHGGQTPKAGIMLVVACGALVVNGVSAWLLHDAIHAAHDIGAHHGHDHGHAHGHAREHDLSAHRAAHDEHEHGHEHGHEHEHDHDHGHDHPHKEDHAHHQAAKAAAAPAKKKAHGHALNLRGAWLHVLGDILGSVAALVAAMIIKFGGHPAADPIASFLVATILVLGAIRLIRDAILVLLEAAPAHLPVESIRAVILAFPGVLEVHELHVWTLGAGHDAITAHVHLTSRDGDAVLAARLSEHLRSKFEVEYVTVQVEVTDEECGAPGK